MITLQSITAAMRLAFDCETAAKTERQKFIARKRHEQAQAQKAWQEELVRRAARKADADGSIARERQKRQEEQERKRLEALTASLVNRQKKHS